MIKIKLVSYFQILMVALCVLVCAAGSAYASPKEEYSSVLGWQNKWDGYVQFSIDDMLSRLRTVSLREIKPEAQDAILADVGFVMAEELSWQTLGQKFSKQIIYQCKKDILDKMVALSLRELPVEDEEVVREKYNRCSKAGFERIGTLIDQANKDMSVEIDFILESGIADVNTAEVKTRWFSKYELTEYLKLLGKVRDGKNYWDRHHWISEIEGKIENRLVKYRLSHGAAPKNKSVEWEWFYNQGNAAFRAKKTKLTKKGYVMAYHQSFEGTYGQPRHQSVWQKVK